MNKHYVLNAFVSAVLLSFSHTAAAQTQGATSRIPERRPLNVIYMMADDMGFADVTAFGGRFGYTPNLDRLAAQGMMMTEFYSACAVCSPTRAAMLTGRYPLANGIDGHFPDEAGIYLRDQTRPDGGAGTLPGILREQGYRTLHVGKWHLGGVAMVELADRKAGQGEFADSQGPHEHGFDDYFISQEDAATGIRRDLNQRAVIYQQGAQHLVHNDVYRHNPDEKRDWTGFKGDVATGFIAEMSETDQPFFLNLWFDVPHAPFEDTHVPPAYHFDTLHLKMDERLGRTAHVLNPELQNERQRENHRRFLSMVTYMDHQVGRVLKAVEDPNGDGDTSDSIAEHTLIIFTSDNGGAWPADNGPFSSGKASVREGGLRVPMIVALRGRIEPGSRSEQIGNTIDFMPSILSMAGDPSEKAVVTIDGIDLSPVWLGRVEAIDRGVMFSDLRAVYRHQRYGAPPEPVGYLIARRGDLKVIFESKDSVNPIALYDLRQDPGETHNLINQSTSVGIIKELTSAAESWIDSMASPSD
ncbi:MAG: sulfatase-like hydrolase/transferase [Planctomycetota bacterium]